MKDHFFRRSLLAENTQNILMGITVVDDERFLRSLGNRDMRTK